MSSILKTRKVTLDRLLFVLENLNTHNLPYVMMYEKQTSKKSNIFVIVGVSKYKIKRKKGMTFEIVDIEIKNVLNKIGYADAKKKKILHDISNDLKKRNH